MRIDHTSLRGRRRGSRRSEGPKVDSVDASNSGATPPVNHSALMGAAVRSVAGEVRTVAVSAEMAASEAHGVSEIAARVASHVADVSTSVDEFASSIEEISRSAAMSAEVVRQAAAASIHANESVDRLTASSREIGAMLELITSIAAQTDLLALNATIEAARAGEVGRGFAVVAAEVKELARATAAATKKISDTVGRLNSDAAVAGEAMTRIGGLVEQFEDSHGSIAAAVEEQAVTTRQIGVAVGEVSAESSQLAEIVASLAGAVYDVTFAASRGRAAAGSIENQLVAAGRIEAVTDDVDPLTAAIAAHSDWKARLVSAIDTCGADLDPRQVSRDDACEFGKWLYHGIDDRRRNSASYGPIRTLHADFHRQAAHIVELAQRGDEMAARASITIGTPFAAASAGLTAELSEWRK